METENVALKSSEDMLQQRSPVTFCDGASCFLGSLTLRVLVWSWCLGLGFLRFSGAILASYFAERRLLIGGLNLKRGLHGL